MSRFIPNHFNQYEAQNYTPFPYEVIIVDGKEMRVGDGFTPGGVAVGGDPNFVEKSVSDTDATSDQSAYLDWLYNGDVVSGTKMVHRVRAILNGTERLLGYWGIDQVNSNNANAQWILATRDDTGSVGIRYRVNGLGQHVWLTDEFHNGTVEFANNISFTTTNGKVITNLPMDAEKAVTFAGQNLRIRSKPGDPLTLQIDAVNARNIEFLTNNQVRFKVDSNGDLLAESLPTFADNAAAVSGGKSTGTLYKTSTGEVRVVV